jgi:hypothetical protein
MVYNFQKYWVFGLDPGRSFYGTQQNRFFFLAPEDGNRSSFRNVVFPLVCFLIPGRWIESENSIFLNKRNVNFTDRNNPLFDIIYKNLPLITYWIIPPPFTSSLHNPTSSSPFTLKHKLPIYLSHNSVDYQPADKFFRKRTTTRNNKIDHIMRLHETTPSLQYKFIEAETCPTITQRNHTPANTTSEHYFRKPLNTIN